MITGEIARRFSTCLVSFLLSLTQAYGKLFHL